MEMKRHGVLMILFVGMAMMGFAQRNDAELADPHPGQQEAWKSLKDISLSWGSTDRRYSRSQVAEGQKSITLYAWRGERVAAQAVVSTPRDIKRMTIGVSDLKGRRGNVIKASEIEKYFVRYTLSDVKELHGDTMLVADRLEWAEEMAVAGNTTRPVWIDIKVPTETKAGRYRGFLTVNCDEQKMALPLVVEVAERVLPEPKDWAFHLDLWQNPYAVARYFDVPLWSKEHFDRMRPVMQRYADAGGKVITTSIIEHPWNGQTYDPFESMIGKMKQVDGTWRYDYTVFDRWVEFMMGLGVTEQIDCYTIVPWHYQFEYYDCATNSVKHLKCRPQSEEYREFLLPLLKDFAQHLKRKGWFSRTCIAMDERPMDQLEAAWKVVTEADPEYRIEGAANYNIDQGSIGAKMYDISVGYQYDLFGQEVLKSRRESGQKLTFYTCCGPFVPNTFTLSGPAEAEFLGWHAAAIGYDGYLRWAFNSWGEKPCQDARFGGWLSGDAFLVYPEGTSIRFERLTEGIQQYEKIRILRETATEEQLAELEAVLGRMRFTEADDDFDFAGLVGEARRCMKGSSRGVQREFKGS